MSARSWCESVRSEPSPEPSLKGRGNSADAVLLTNGDRLTGKLTELDRGSLAIETRGGVAKLPLSRVEAIGLGGQPSAGSRQQADEPSPSPSLKGRGKLAIGLRDGSLVYAKAIRADEKDVEIELANGVKLKGGDVDDIVAIQSLGGPVVYLSDLEGADYRDVPYLSIEVAVYARSQCAGRADRGSREAVLEGHRHALGGAADVSVRWRLSAIRFGGGDR